jgi:hypothetical protein
MWLASLFGVTAAAIELSSVYRACSERMWAGSLSRNGTYACALLPCSAAACVRHSVTFHVADDLVLGQHLLCLQTT